MANPLMKFRFIQQFVALYKKNLLVAWRNRRATLIRLTAPFLFLLLALLIQKALEADSRRQERFRDNPGAVVVPIKPVPSCNQDLYIGATKDCFHFFYTPTGDPDVEAVVQGILDNNNPPLSKSKVRGFATRNESDVAMFNSGSDTVLGAVHFYKDASTSQISFVVQSNTSTKYIKGDYQDPNLFFEVPMTSATQREIVRQYLRKSGDTAKASSLAWEPTLRKFPHPALDSTSVVGFVIGPFIFAACMFSFVTQLGLVVQEKELGLRQALCNMGMTDLAYWVSWQAWDVTMAFITSHLICIFGLILQFDLFKKNDYGILFFLFFLFQMAMNSMAYALSTVIRKSQTGVYTGFLIFLVGWICQVVVIFGVPYSPDYIDSADGHLTRAFSALPWDLLAKGVIDLGQATNNENDPGIRWWQRTSYCQNIPNIKDQPAYNPREEYKNFNCVFPMSQIYGTLVILYFVYGVLAIYLDNVVPNEMGVSRPMWYFLLPGYWMPQQVDSSKALTKVADMDAKGLRQPPAEGGSADEDVAEEEKRLRAMLAHRTGRAGELAAQADTGRNAVEVYGLRKMFASSGLSCNSAPPFWAIKGSWFHIPENQLFCLLGPNGAGKTTTIKCLTGELPYTGGDALIYGQSISSAGGINTIRSLMGVCPQFDVLWNELTAKEHLEIYGSVKGITWESVTSEALTLLEKVKLTYAANQRSGSFSGGMKRRLSVAIALLGNPKIVYLDEPTTGMDPISRRYVWDIIQEAKAGRAIVLTTHSMEEADILGDRIAIMARGKLRCLGSSIRLKQKFGAGYQVSVSVMSARGSQQDLASLARKAGDVKEYFRQGLGLEPTDESKAYVSYLVERSREEQLITFLKQLEQDQERLGVTDVQLSLTSLEEVFLTIARKAELDAAQASGGLVTLPVPLADGSTLNVPLGEEYVVHPNTGVYYQVRWGQDDAGKLVVMDCKEIDASRVPAANGSNGAVEPANVHLAARLP